MGHKSSFFLAYELFDLPRNFLFVRKPLYSIPFLYQCHWNIFLTVIHTSCTSIFLTLGSQFLPSMIFIGNKILSYCYYVEMLIEHLVIKENNKSKRSWKKHDLLFFFVFIIFFLYFITSCLFGNNISHS